MQLEKAARLLHGSLVGFLTIILFTGVSYGAGTVAPEVDSSLAGGTVALVVGSYLVLVSKVRRKK